MEKKNIKYGIIIIILALAFSIISFLLDVRKGIVFWIAYIFEMIAIFAQLLIIKVSFSDGGERKSKILGFPVFRIGIIYLIIQTIASSIFLILGDNKDFPAALVASICVLILSSAAVLCIATNSAKEQIQRIDVFKKQEQSTIIYLRSLSASLPSLTEDPSLKRALSDLAERFRFSDPVGSTATADIEYKLKCDLQSLSEKVSNGLADETTIKSIQNDLAMRNEICKANK